MDIIYPPYIEGILPSFIKEESSSIFIPYKMNPGVSFSQIKGFSLQIKNVNSNRILYTLTTNTFADGIATFLTDNGWMPKVQQYYKMQLAYISYDDSVSPYSTVGVIKCIEKPIYDFFITGNNIIFKYNSNNLETLQNYTLDIFENEVLVKQEIVQAEDKELYHHTYWFKGGKDYDIKLTYTTTNLYTEELSLFKTLTDYVYPENTDIINHSYFNYDKGIVYIDFEFTNTEIEKASLYHLYRTKINGGDKWELLEALTINNNHIKYEDNIIEHGATYLYRLALSSPEGAYSSPITEVEIGPVYFEDMYLSDGNKTLKVRFNPKVSSVKNIILEQKTDTLGSQYPFFFRNGKVKYKEFPINGLISYLQDEEEKFMSKQELGLENNLSFRVKTQGEKLAAANVPTTSLTSYNIEAERRFKNAVLDWLSNGQPKLLKTPTEGTFIVYLMNVSLSPEDQLGRMLHSFSATAYEMTDFTIGNCQNLNIITPVSKTAQVIDGTKILMSKSSEEIFEGLTLYNLFHIQISDIEGKCIIDGKEEIQLNFGETLVIDKFIKKIEITEVEKIGGGITYVQLEQMATYRLDTFSFDVNEQTKLTVGEGDLANAIYITEINIVGKSDNTKYQIDDEAEIELGKNEALISGLTAQTVTITNEAECSIKYLVKDIEEISNLLERYQEPISTLRIDGGKVNGE